MLKEITCVKENQSNTDVKAVKIHFIETMCNGGKGVQYVTGFKSEPARTSGNYRQGTGNVRRGFGG